MLPRWHSEAELLLAPGGFALRAVARGLRPSARVTQRACPPQPGGQAWRAPLAALADALHELPRGARLRVVLSSGFARYALVPFSAAVVGRAATEALAAQVFRQVHGERADAWRIRVAGAPVGRQGLACALDAALLEALAEAARARGIARLALEPSLAAAFNAARRRLPRSCWFVVTEPGSRVLALLIDGAWRHVAAERCDSQTDADLAQALAREAFLAEDAPADLPCWRAHFDPAAKRALKPELRLQ